MENNFEQFEQKEATNLNKNISTVSLTDIRDLGNIKTFYFCLEFCGLNLTEHQIKRFNLLCCFIDVPFKEKCHDYEIHFIETESNEIEEFLEYLNKYKEKFVIKVHKLLKNWYVDFTYVLNSAEFISYKICSNGYSMFYKLIFGYEDLGIQPNHIIDNLF